MDNPTKIIVTLSMDAQTGEISFFKDGEFYNTGRSDNQELWAELLAYCKDWKSADQIKNDELLGIILESDPTKASDFIKDWTEEEWVKKGDFRKDDGIIYEVHQGHLTLSTNRPSVHGLTSLWLNPRPVDTPEDAVAEFGFWLDGTERNLGVDWYMSGEKAKENGLVYECIKDATVWPPSIQPDHWKLIE